MGAINLADAKAHLSELVDRVEAGECIHISRRGTSRKAYARHKVAQADRCSDAEGPDGIPSRTA